MATKLLYHGPLWQGSTSLQRLNAFQLVDDVIAIGHDIGRTFERVPSLWQRIRWRLRFPIDVFSENETVIEAAKKYRPDIIIVDNSKVIANSTLKKLRDIGVSHLVYYTPDDIFATHNLSIPLRRSLRSWDIVFSTKTFNIPELHAAGVKRPLLIGKAYDPELHVELNRGDVGQEYEKFDVVFVGAYEKERCASINALAVAGFSVVVYGAGKSGWRGASMASGVELRPPVFAEDYTVALHTGKIALCFLRKINRDRITQRTMEIAAMGRPMVAERTDEHSQHFVDGVEYASFLDDAELVDKVRSLLSDEDVRRALGRAGKVRCVSSGYSTLDRAREMLSRIVGR